VLLFGDLLRGDSGRVVVCAIRDAARVEKLLDVRLHRRMDRGKTRSRRALGSFGRARVLRAGLLLGPRDPPLASAGAIARPSRRRHRSRDGPRSPASLHREGTMNLQVTFRHLEPSPRLEQLIREQAEKLDSFYGHIMSCHVMVDAIHRLHPNATVFQVRIDLTVPGGELYVGRDAGDPRTHEDVYFAVREAFHAIRRQLQDYARRQRGETKTHEPVQEHARVSKFFPQQGYGFLETEDGRDVYFHRNAVLNGDFDRLEVGTEVRFQEEQAFEGPQASTVAVVGKDGYHEFDPELRAVQR
jgi:cold shock CspA family protein/ribosome-associated translation inhibitor RaiA